MASAEIFNLNTVNLVPTKINQFSDKNSMDLSMDDLKLFEPLEMNGTTSNGGINSSGNTSNGSANGDPMDGALEDSRSMSEDADQDCKICK